MNTLLDTIGDIASVYTKRMRFLCTISANQKHVRYNIPSRMRGIYVIYPKGKTDVPVYIGETIDCVNSRVSRHKRSLRDPEWFGEVTGKKFNTCNIDRFQEFDVYFIEYDTKISKYDSRTLEGVFKLALKPIVFE